MLSRMKFVPLFGRNAPRLRPAGNGEAGLAAGDRCPPRLSPPRPCEAGFKACVAGVNGAGGMSRPSNEPAGNEFVMEGSPEAPMFGMLGAPGINRECVCVGGLPPCMP